MGTYRPTEWFGNAYVGRRNRPKNRHNKRKRVFERDNYMCVNCKTTEYLTIDHIIPLSKGGRNNINNLQTLCHDCNQKKADKI